MITGIAFALLAATVPAAYLFGRRMASQRAVDEILDSALDPQVDPAEFVATLRLARKGRA